MNSNQLIKTIIEYNKLTNDQIEQLENPIELSYSSHPIFLSAVNRIQQAIAHKEKVMICGDYDGDGLCGTSILVISLRRLGLEVGFYIPNRFEDGYGLSVATVEKALTKGYSLFITVDNGVSAFEAIKTIHAASKSILVLDHHERTEDPHADILIHPDFLETPYQKICGSALAFILSNHLIGEDPYITALAGIATIADMMPLWDFNRSLVMEALRQLNTHRFTQITGLLKDANSEITEEALSFHVIPKLNAVGRLADIANPNRIIDFLVSEDLALIQSMIQQIIDVNDQRKLINQSMYETANQMVDDAKVLILKDSSFHEGVVGITAGRLANTYKRPVMVLHDNGTRLKGSARSYGNIDLRTLISPAMSYLTRYGGHAAAAGLELNTQDFLNFRNAVLSSDVLFETDDLSSGDFIDFDASLMQVSLWTNLRTWAPFGMGFMIPSFYVSNAQVLSSRGIKGGMKLQVQIQNTQYDVLYFGELKSQDLTNMCSFVCRVSTNTFRQKTSLSLMIEHFA